MTAQRRTNSSTCMECCPLRTYQRRFLPTSIRRASSATLMLRSCRARSILVTMRSAWFIRLLALSSLPASGAGARTLGGSRIVANRTNSPATYGEKGLLQGGLFPFWEHMRATKGCSDAGVTWLRLFRGHLKNATNFARTPVPSHLLTSETRRKMGYAKSIRIMMQTYAC